MIQQIQKPKFQHKVTPDFVRKLQEIINLYPALLNWSQCGQQVIIHSISQLAISVLPIYFRHTKFTSFIRQLNMYGFKKKVQSEDMMILEHDVFRKGNEQNFILIERKKRQKYDRESEKKFKRKYWRVLTKIQENEILEEELKQVIINLMEYKERANINLKKVKKIMEKICLQLKDTRLTNVADSVKELKVSLLPIVQKQIENYSGIDSLIEREDEGCDCHSGNEEERKLRESEIGQMYLDYSPDEVSLVNHASKEDFN